MSIMSDIASGGLAGIGTAVQSIGSGITDFIAHVQGKLSPQEQAQLQQFADQAIATQMAAQAEINKVEAASPNLFTAGWRPFIGWICGIAIAYNFLIIPFVALFLRIFKAEFTMPALDMGELWTLVTGMLGLGTMRTVEKLQGAAGKH